MRIVFAGTPAFGIPCLDALACSSHTLLTLYTQPDKPCGRGQKLQSSAVKEWANKHHYPVLQPLHLKSEEARNTLQSLQPDIMVVIAYGLLLPESILSIPSLGCINVHASLLPRFRGASPLSYAVLQGDRESGISIMQMNQGLDTGDVLAMRSCLLDSEETAVTLHDKLAALAPPLLLSTLSLLEAGKITPTVQQESDATYAPKIKKEDAKIDWALSAVQIQRQVRAFLPWPIAYTYLQEKMVRIYASTVEEGWPQALPGTILAIEKRGMLVATGEHALCIEQLQLAGGKVLPVSAWRNSGQAKEFLHQMFVS